MKKYKVELKMVINFDIEEENVEKAIEKAKNEAAFYFFTDPQTFDFVSIKEEEEEGE